MKLIMLFFLTSCSMFIPERDFSLESERSLRKICLAQGKILIEIKPDGRGICGDEK